MRALSAALVFASSVAIPAHGSSPARAQLAGAHLTGRIVFDAVDHPSPGTGFMRVFIYPTGEERLWERISVGLAQNPYPKTEANYDDGTFELSGIPAGRWTISIGGRQKPGFWIRSAICGSVDLMDTPLVVGATATELPAVLITYTDRHTEISGTVSGSVPAGSAVLVFTSNQSLWRPQARRVKAAPVAADRRFSVTDLPPGEYWVTISTHFQPADLSDSKVLELASRGATKVTLGEASRVTDLVLTAGLR